MISMLIKDQHPTYFSGGGESSSYKYEYRYENTTITNGVYW